MRYPFPILASFACALAASPAYPLAATAQAPAPADATPGAGQSPPNERIQTEPGQRSLIEVAAAIETLDPFLDLLQASPLEDRLAVGGPYSLIAPSETALARLPEDRLEFLLDEENHRERTAFLRQHIILGRLILGAGNKGTFQTLARPLKVERLDNGILRIGSAIVVRPGIEARNGVIYLVNRPLGEPVEPPPGDLTRDEDTRSLED